MATFTLRPNAAGDETNLTPSAGDNYACVDEAVADDATTYVYHEVQSSWVRDLYNMEAPPAGTGVISSVAIYFRIGCGGGESLVQNH